jgi:prepilin-type N-terminal cleavage/methylation domain-containing protein
MRHAKKIKNISGFTLIEILIASAISTVAITMIYAVYMSGNDLWETKRYQTDIQAAARMALNEMTTELKEATKTSSQNPSPNLSIPSVPNNKHITFCLPGDKDGDGLITDANGQIEWITNNNIQYQYIPGQKQLRRLEGGDQRVLANDVTDVQFIDNGIDGSLYLTELKIILTISKTTPRGRTLSITQSARVKLRN